MAAVSPCQSADPTQTLDDDLKGACKQPKGVLVESANPNVTVERVLRTRHGRAKFRVLSKVFAPTHQDRQRGVRGKDRMDLECWIPTTTAQPVPAPGVLSIGRSQGRLGETGQRASGRARAPALIRV